jgi:hypothetical protein
MFNHDKYQNTLQNNQLPNHSKLPTIAELYPNYSSEEQAEASETLSRYLALVRRIYERIKSENGNNVCKDEKFD